MPPRLNLRAVSRSLVILSRTSTASSQPRIARVVARRTFTEEKGQQPALGPNQDVLPHVSEEAADIADITGGTKPDTSQGTPVQDVCSSTESIGVK
jgi:small subunit ribosomal protein S7